MAVLLATYNGASYLTEQLESIFAQESCELDVWVSDDQSTDGTWEWLQNAAVGNARLHLLPRIDRAGSAAKNFYRLLRDVDLSAYEFIALADQDDIWLTDKLILSIHELQRHDADGVSSDVVAFWQDGRRRLVKKSYPQRRMDFLFESAGQGCTYVITSRCASEFNRFLAANDTAVNAISFHDWLLYAWVRANGRRWHIIARPTISYRQHQENVLGANSGWRALRDRYSQTQSGWYRNQILRLAQLIQTAPNFTPECASVIASLESNSVSGRLAVARKSGQLRRRVKDRILLAVACIVGAI